MNNEIVPYNEEQIMPLGNSGFYMNPNQVVDNVSKYLETTTPEQMQRDFETILKILVGVAVVGVGIYALRQTARA